ncbi:hypothetical protein FOZ62_008522, partial [Perkinsus olseni]
TSGVVDESVQTMPPTSTPSSLDKPVKNPVRCARPRDSPPDFTVGGVSDSLQLPSRHSDDVRSHLGFGDDDDDSSPSLAQRRAFAEAGAPICLLQPPDPYDFYDDPEKGEHTGFEPWPADDQEVYDEFENDDIGGNLDDYAVPLLPGPEEPDVVLPDLPVSERPELRPIQDLCNDFSQLFRNKIGFCPLVNHDIKTTDEKPVAQRPRRVPHKWQADIRGQINDMLREGIIRPSTSAWRSPCVYVKKKTGGVRICVDYRELNRRSQMSAYPLPRPDFVQDDLKGARFFTSLDLKSGYWQVPVSAADVAKTAFCPGNGFPLYEFVRMPFGLHDAPATFQKLMEDILGDLPFVKIYLDDILIFSADMETHVRHLRVVFERLSAANITLGASKCDFAMEEIAYLGHIYDKYGMRPDPDRVRCISEWPLPETVRD